MTICEAGSDFRQSVVLPSRASHHGLYCRDKWLFKPAKSPAAMGPCEEVARPSLLEAKPFEWSPQEPSDFEFEMVNGIIRIYRGSQRETEAFPVPGSSYDFFSDMHW